RGLSGRGDLARRVGRGRCGPRLRRARHRAGPPAGRTPRRGGRGIAYRRSRLVLRDGAVRRLVGRGVGGSRRRRIRRCAAGGASRCRAVRRFPPRADQTHGPPRGSAMIDVAASKSSPPKSTPPTALVDQAITLLDSVPYTLLALPLRLGAAVVFWNSAQAK